MIKLDFSGFLKKPKWICGFSDNTVFHLHCVQFQTPTIHSTVPYLISKHQDQETIGSFKKALFGELKHIHLRSHRMNRDGKAYGKLIGGNLSILVNQIGTPSLPDFKGTILFIEDLDEHHYHLDRMFIQLKRIGILNSIAGLLVGQFSHLKDTAEYFGKSVHDIIYEHTKSYSFPICFNFPAGHEKNNLSFYMGSEIELLVEGESRVNYPLLNHKKQ